MQNPPSYTSSIFSQWSNKALKENVALKKTAQYSDGFTYVETLSKNYY